MVRGKHRWHIIVKSPSEETTRNMLDAAKALLTVSGKLQVIVDVDALALL
jgi:primosomal protein N'